MDFFIFELKFVPHNPTGQSTKSECQHLLDTFVLTLAVHGLVLQLCVHVCVELMRGLMERNFFL